jgi:ParB family transcriptional regulator, chromosome partitioning protein
MEATMVDEKRKGLGRGLSALMGEPTAPGGGAPRATRELPIEQLHPGRFQPRKRFDETELDALASSIREVGLVQPIVVRRRTPGAEEYEIVAGERRWRAAQRAALHQVPVVVKEITDTQAMEFALVENLQRQDLNPLEEAQGYRRMVEEFGHTQEQLAKVVGKSRSHVANTLRLLGLPEGVRLLVEDGRLSAGHARALIGAADPEALARKIVDRGMNVRQAERLAQGDTPKQGKAARLEAAPAHKDADTRALEANLSAALGLTVTIDFAGEGGGEVRIKYGTLEQLDEVCRRICRTD